VTRSSGVTTTIRRCLLGISAVAVVIGAPLAGAPLASAGCQPWAGAAQQLCDDPIQPDGTWQRCIVYTVNPDFNKSECFTLGGNHFLPPFEPPGHIDP
jgi:hypothetical protein